MKVKISKRLTIIIQKLITLFFIFCCIACVLVTLLPWWPSFDSLVIPKYLLLFGPRWWLLILLLFILVGWKCFSNRQRIIFPILVLFSLNYLDLQLPQIWHGNNKGKAIKIVSANIGGGGSKEVIQVLVATEQPDILFLQEAFRIDLTKILDDRYFSECISGLCIASIFPFEQVGSLNRNIFEGWGRFAIFYNIRIANHEISLANIHFETPRSVLMGAISGYLDFSLAKNIESNRILEANLINTWAKDKPHVIIAGDFNMPEDDNIFQQNFSEFNNAIGIKGIGFNYTKHTSWHGVRIDHILFSAGFQLQNVQVIEFLKGDHRPVMATFTLTN